MQATSTKRFVRSRAGGMAAAFSILIGGIIAVSAFAIGDVASNESAVESARMMPNAYTSPGQGEGLVDSTNRRFDRIQFLEDNTIFQTPPPVPGMSYGD